MSRKLQWLLKRLVDAMRNGDLVCVIRSTAKNSDDLTPNNLTPNTVAQTSATDTAYAAAGISAFSSTGYRESRGTGSWR
jgi:acyl transferase domain-containing protein